MELEEDEEEAEEADGGVCGVRDEEATEPDDEYPLLELEHLEALVADDEEAVELEDEDV